MSVIIVLRAVRKPRLPNLPNPLQFIPSFKTKGRGNVGTLVSPLLPNFLFLLFLTYLSPLLGGKVKGRPSFKGEQVKGNDSVHNHYHRTRHNAVLTGDSKLCSPLESSTRLPFVLNDIRLHFCAVQKCDVYDGHKEFSLACYRAAHIPDQHA
ncbi:hypothetical protein J6590_043869 [Homalodisca vitripennis]|nr:hypothetical protein J6590_043869 [Homalodisca vitripennis]